MRLFLELEVEESIEDIARGIPPQGIRIRVPDEEDAQRKLKLAIPLLPEGTAYIHYCCHDEDPPKPCWREKIWEPSRDEERGSIPA